MGLLINNKIGVSLPGTPTVSDKYDVVTAIVGAAPVVAGQFVEIDKVFSGAGKPHTDVVKTTSKYVGVVMHQNIKVEGFNAPNVQVFMPGDVIGVCIKGFMLTVADKSFEVTSPAKVKNGGLSSASDAVALPKTVVLTGWNETKGEQKLVEVELR